MVKKGKEIDTDRAYANPITGDVIYSHYQDGTEIELNAEQKKKAEEAKQACTGVSIKEVESNPAARKKPLEKRGRPKKEK